MSWNLHKMNAAPLQTSALLVKEKVGILYQKTIFPIQEFFCTYTISTESITIQNKHEYYIYIPFKLHIHPIKLLIHSRTIIFLANNPNMIHQSVS